MRDVGLTYCRLRLAEDLPVRVHRLLRAAIALMTYPKVQILRDEATWNMHPRTRRDTWELLFVVLRYNGVSLTNSDFAEAEALAYCLLFLQHGEPHCVDSPKYIKAQFRNGSPTQQRRRLSRHRRAGPHPQGVAVPRQRDGQVQERAIQTHRHLRDALHSYA
ncbi:ATP-binding cassette sub-family A member 13-like [Dermacentor silvarum]|uniref:ATP-binding cassette sub-family A member 13-like n=1 Tax=Dermacentor silvarum TaxID=543639 RepID=UPI0021009FF7|nr:ATP-binding cassette sub-family A member 13-like [Dermacentor silvarum]